MGLIVRPSVHPPVSPKPAFFEYAITRVLDYDRWIGVEDGEGESGGGGSEGGGRI